LRLTIFVLKWEWTLERPTMEVSEMKLVKSVALNAANAIEISKEHRDATLAVEHLCVVVRFMQKPSDHVLSFLREHGFRWNKERKAWICDVEAVEVESAEEREAAANDFAAALDILAKRQRAAKLFTQALAEEVLRALDGMRVVLIDTTREVVEIYEGGESDAREI
jgi:DNA polymerase I-like protein with 3'-5' exonuclease and polymerase domains